MPQTTNNLKKGSCLVNCLKIVAVLILFPLVIMFGWLAGIVWLVFFRKKMADNPGKQMKYTIGISAISLFSFFIMCYALVTAPPPVDEIVISSDMEGHVLDPDIDYIITADLSPKDAGTSSLKYEIDDRTIAEITMDSTNPLQATLHTKTEGQITIKATAGNTESNSITFEIVDRNKKENSELSKATEVQQPSEEPSEKVSAEKETESVIPSETENTEMSAGIESGTYDIAGESFQFSDSVRNDVTGNWRIAKVATSKDVTEYAVDYYNTLFSSNDEIHAIVNFTSNTTVRLSVLYDGMLDVTVFEYVDKEEHDAKKLFGGTLLAQYTINIETKEIEGDTAPPKQTGSDNTRTTDKTSSGSSSAPTDTVTSSNEANAGSDSIPADAASSSNESNTATDTNNTGNTGDGSNFNTYNNEQQQQTSDTYVLNTSSHKVHYPSCASVKKIAPQNHATSSQSLDELLAQGYTTCGNCFK